MDSHQHEHQSGWLREFQGFVLHSNVVDIAIGVSIGATVTLLIDSLIKGV
ncbi:MAG: MscL family protein, partial [Acetobacter sp.]|nr:MscL family protein [Acetobacter sp.]